MESHHRCGLDAVAGDSRVLICLFIGSEAVADGQPEQADTGHGWTFRVTAAVGVVIAPAAVPILTRDEAPRNQRQRPFHGYAMAPGGPESQRGKLAVRVVGRAANLMRLVLGLAEHGSG